ncbi:MAG: DUF3047 domain-containing protein [Rhodothermales bacterium]
MEPNGSTYPWGDSSVVVADFEGDTPGALPSGWGYLSSRNRRFQSAVAVMDPNQKFEVHAEEGNRFVRAYTKGEAQRISLRAEALDWKLSEYPRLRWSWRALRLPEGAREDRVNDSGGAIYVSFSKTDWLGRPLSIKYTYSSTLPVGTVVSTGNVKIIVASSGLNGIGSWLTVDRNVVDDYRRVFGSDPPDEPFTITLWSDSDNTGSIGEVDFDDIEIVTE